MNQQTYQKQFSQENAAVFRQKASVTIGRLMAAALKVALPIIFKIGANVWLVVANFKDGTQKRSLPRREAHIARGYDR